MAKRIEQAADKQKRKDLARTRSFWFFLILDVALVIFFIASILLLTLK